ncbi:TonB family protein [Thalassotalea agarivorans]|uniref:TonB family C-terminal domain-containing protein n=1 Tax=Thalassotalea agarivorans TaxID=349064 RepID=A0A1I0E3Z0_THASX|nr:TonB family protein [Thalassotalea agarivorans]SET38935.1 TonB family C-terminal domain-containing protein [Thalassotalea agarivorans]
MTNRTDEVLNNLYQQRKAQVSAPLPNLPKQQVRTSLVQRLFRVLGVTLGAGFASFGILAVVSQLIKQPHQVPRLTNAHETSVVVASSRKGEEPVPTAKQKSAELSDKPSAREMPSHEAMPTHESTSVAPSQIETLASVSSLSVDTKITHKVLPRFNKQQLKLSLESVTLQYEIDDKGNVKNIGVVNSTTSKPIEKAAKQALAQWRFDKNTAAKQAQVTFEFRR